VSGKAGGAVLTWVIDSLMRLLAVGPAEVVGVWSASCSQDCGCVRGILPSENEPQVHDVLLFPCVPQAKLNNFTSTLLLPCACQHMQIIVANPKTAGVARWIFLALWGSKMKKGDAAAIEYITKVCWCADNDNAT
jgi:hypothetical protein